MMVILYLLCLGALIAGVCRGTPRMSSDTSRAAAETLLFWGSVLGLLALLVSLLSIIGILHACSKSEAEPTIYDALFEAGQYIGWFCGACAGMGHLLLVCWNKI
ncbi:MAG: hypothetical protein NTY53_17235 [Kiritimatiellaeota bacterium]|nr:hypothetical protein [Kiritimatiellota bacterium]